MSIRGWIKDIIAARRGTTRFCHVCGREMFTAHSLGITYCLTYIQVGMDNEMVVLGTWQRKPHSWFATHYAFQSLMEERAKTQKKR